jgi:hypothetical protein
MKYLCLQPETDGVHHLLDFQQPEELRKEGRKAEKKEGRKGGIKGRKGGRK